MPNHDRTHAIHSLLKQFEGLEPLKQLFWTELNYPRINRPISRNQWTEAQRSLLAEDPILFAGAGDDQGFQIVYARLDSSRLLLTAERTVVSRLQREHPHALFVFSNDSQDSWHFINVKQEAQEASRSREGGRKAPQLFRRITIGREERLRTASERIVLLDLAGITGNLFGLSPLDIQKKHDEAFDVETVTKQFFEGYKALFGIIQDDLAKQTKDAVWAHDYALQFLNRLMFLYFVQRKRWLGEETEFLRLFWEAYQDAKQPKDTFFEKWLSVLFFEAFNNQFHGGHRHFPDAIQKALQMAPYLNGGLFKPNRLDTNPPKTFTISDAMFRQAFSFLEKYNFTIAEDSPLDQEVAVDPEMIGKVYESLVNVSSEADERGDAGIFYTPRTEIDLMCRLALVDNLANHLGQQHKNLLYELVFALDPEDKEAADRRVMEAGLWDHLNDRLQETTVVDPACGSGSFLVGMLHVLDDLQARAARHLRIGEDSYDRKKRIIGQSLYGVDVMEWACHVAELRLWLALIIDADIDTTAAHVRKEPLLPHFSFKIRCGDSLVQEVGGLNMAHIKGSRLIPPPLKRKITIHKERKLQFYNNDKEREYKTEEQVREAELRLFREILAAQETTIGLEITGLQQRIANPKARQMNIYGTVDATPQLELEAAELQAKIDDAEAHRQRLAEAREALQSVHNVPFVWDIAFVEIFEGESDGFDIVVGNPPYVTRTKIAPPHEREQDHTASQWRHLKDEYKARLQSATARAHPSFFCWPSGQRRPGRVPSTMSDLYVYFYFHGLSLLNQEGTFCFITGNSWLDVGFGADLQEFLLKHTSIRFIMDSTARRVFSEALVNATIVTVSAPQANLQQALSNMARFVVFRVPYEVIVSPVIFSELEAADHRRSTVEYRVYPVRQSQLLAEGLSSAEAGTRGRANRKQPPAAMPPRLVANQEYGGGRWGGLYLRAPDALYAVRESNAVCSVSSVADVRLGVTTGANEFFFITRIGTDRYVASLGGEQREFDYPDKYALPVLRTVRECDNFTFDPRTEWRIVALPEKLPDQASRRYVRWAESVGIHERPFFQGRRCWYSLSTFPSERIAVPELVNDRYFFLWNPSGCVINKNFYAVSTLHHDEDLLWPLLNSSLTFLQFELYGRKPGGGASGIGVQIAKDVLIANPMAISASDRKVLVKAATALRDQPILAIADDIERPERRSIDDTLFGVVGLSKTASDEIRCCLLELVRMRLARATAT